MSDRSAFHLTGNRIKPLMNLCLLLRCADKQIPCGNRSDMIVNSFFCQAAAQQSAHFFICRQIHFVDTGKKSNRISQRCRIHIVLHYLICHSNIHYAKFFAKRTTHTDIDHIIHMKLQNHCLRTDRGKHLADSTHCCNHFFVPNGSTHIGDTTVFFRADITHGCFQVIHLNLHRTNYSDSHVSFPPTICFIPDM